MLTDPIADYLTRIRNALGSGHDEVEIPASRLKLEMSRILKEQCYILDFGRMEMRGGQEHISEGSGRIFVLEAAEAAGATTGSK